METKNFYICSALNERQNAQMVKSVDTLVSGTSARKGVQVRVLFWAPKYRMNHLRSTQISNLGAFLFYSIFLMRIIGKKMQISLIEYWIIFISEFSDQNNLYQLNQERII